MGWAGLTKAGFIPNYLAVEFLYSKQEQEGFDLMHFQPRRDGLMKLGKPVIYFYPEKQQQVDVKLNYLGNLTFSYPEYEDGWHVVAYPSGRIINISDSKEYSYLFWEGEMKNPNFDLSKGFVVKGSETAKFLQERLSQLGLTPKEYNEMIVYWLPKMQNNKFNIIHFATKEEYDDKVVLDITPKPDSMLRILMVYKGLENDNVTVTPQEIKPFIRKGFTVVEWGATVVK